MRRLLHILKSRHVLIGLGTALLVALIWAGGAWLDWPVTWRLAGVIGALVLCIVLLAVSAARANRAAAGIEQSIKRQAEQQQMSARPDQRADIGEMQDRLEGAIETLKRSKLGRGRRGKAALYALPWYLFVGPPGAGKTTAISNSALNFPLGSDRVRGIGGTRNCDWFFSDSAILLDTAGRYMTEAKDAEEWRAFLDALREHRPARPINGVLVGISIADLLGASVEDLEWHADRIRRRIDELIERLGVRFPVYLLFTKCDLLEGFVEFFGDLPRKERGQVWGHTFERKEEGPPDLGARFEAAFDRLGATLPGRRAERLCRSMKREDRRKVYVFPLEFAAAKEDLAHFVHRLFQPNPYQESPLFRGFYFTSGTQEGVPLDRVIQSIGQQFDLPAEPSHAFDAEIETKSYFLKNVFTDVVIPDQYLVSPTSKAVTKGRLLRTGVGVAAAVLLGLFMLGASQALVRSQLRLGEVQEAAEAVRAVDWAAPRASVPEAVARMDRLREEVARLERHEQDPPLLGWGLHRGGQVLEPARQLYYHKARAFLYDYPFQTLERRLRQALRRQRPSRRDARYDDLRAYLLLTREAKHLSERADRAFLKAHLTGLLDSTLVRRAAAPGQQLNDFQQRVRRQVEAVVEGVRQGAAPSFQADASLVVNVRNLIYQEPSVAGLYRRIKEEGNATLPPFTLAKAVPRRDLSLFATMPEVPGVFTKAGWENFARKAIEQQGGHPSRGDWVLGHTPEDLPEGMQNSDQLIKELKTLYLGEYASHWQRFLRSVRFKRFEDLGTARRVMVRVANRTDSPLLYLLARVTKETTFQSELAQSAKRQGKEAGKRAVNRRVRRLTRNPNAGVKLEDDAPQKLPLVDRRFAALHALKPNRAVSGGASSSLYAAMDELSRLRGALDNMSSDDGAVQYAKAVFQENGGQLAQSLRSVRGALPQLDPQVRQSLFDQPLIFSWGAVLNAAQKQINARWRAAVYKPYQAKLAGLYPFDTDSQQGAPLKDVENFFHPQEGTLTTFYEEMLAPFLESDMQPQTYEGRGLRLSASARRALRQARGIASGLFEGGVLRLPFTLQAELPERSDGAPPVDQVYVFAGRQESIYRMGSYRPWTSFQWPGGASVTLGVSTQEGDLSPRQFDGPWAWFRLLQQAHVQRRTPSTYRVRWPFEQPGRYTITARYNLRTQSSTSPFGDVRSFFNLRLPPQLD